MEQLSPGQRMPLIIASIVVGLAAGAPYLVEYLVTNRYTPDLPLFHWSELDASMLLGAVAGYLFLQGLVRPKGPKVVENPDTVRDLQEAQNSLDSLIGDYRASKEQEEELTRALAEADKKLEAERAKQASADRTNAEVANLLSIFQSKGRFIDFLMQDITPFPDAQVGSVARFVHQGCRAALKDHFDVTPIHEGGEGETISVPKEFDPRLYRLTGKVKEAAPMKGTVVHRGWKTARVQVPRVTSDKGDPFVLAPAEIDVES